MTNDKYNLDDLLHEESHDYIIEKDFYPPYDDRCLESYIENIDGGDNFADYCSYIFKILEEEGYYE